MVESALTKELVLFSVFPQLRYQPLLTEQQHSELRRILKQHQRPSNKALSHRRSRSRGGLLYTDSTLTLLITESTDENVTDFVSQQSLLDYGGFFVGVASKIRRELLVSPSGTKKLGFVLNNRLQGQPSQDLQGSRKARNCCSEPVRWSLLVYP